ncbi:MAG: hypothetical protein AAFR61_15370 [Bacteroidota bacterium]
MATTTQNSKTTSRAILVIASILVLSALGYFSVKYFSEKNASQQKDTRLSELSQEIVQLEDEIFNFKNELESKDMDLASQRMLLDEKDQALKQMAAQLETARSQELARSREIRNMENRIKELQSVVSNYQERLAFLEQQNQVLAGQVDSLVENETQLKSQFQTLQEENNATTEQLAQTVQLASALQTKDFVFFNVSKKGKEKQDVSFRRRGLENLKICFTILENLIAAPGQRRVYVVWENPDGSTNTNFNDSFSGSFTLDGQKTTYTASQAIEFNRRSQDVCITYTPSDENKPQKGNQAIYVYADNELIGQGNFTIK